MRKLFTTLKSVVAAAVVVSMTLAASCSYDDTAIKNRIDEVEKDVDKVQADLATLTERVAKLENQLSTDVANLTALINGKVVVTGVTTDDAGATTVTLSDGKSFVVYPECDVVDTDTDTNTTLAPAKDEDGVLYWALYDGGKFTSWLEVEGAKVPVYDGNDKCNGVVDTNDNDDTIVAPYADEDGTYYYAVIDVKNENKFVEWYLVDGEKVNVYDGNDNTCDYVPVELTFQVNDEGKLVFSIDGGTTWAETGLSAAEAGAAVFTSVTPYDNYVTFFLPDGSEFSVLKADYIEFNTTRGHVYVQPDQTIDITFTINDAVADVNVMNQPLGWKASIELAAADEEAGEGDENVEPDMGIMAAGGTEFVLKVTGPSQSFIDAGYAEANGFVTVHFNSVNGACKVGKIAVELASINLEVDKAGNITITNTWVDSYEYEDWGNIIQVQEFNNYFVTIMPIDNYVEDLTSIWNASSWEWDVPTVGGWINNFFYNVNEEYNTIDKSTYQEGVNEKWVFKATVEDVLKALDWSGEFTYEGNSFAVIVTPTNPHNYSSLMIEQSQVAFFKQLNVKVELTETTWNAAYFNATLRGGNAYHFNINTKADLQYQIDNGWYADFESYYNDYIFYWQQYGSQFGEYTLNTDVQAEDIDFSDLMNFGEEYPYPYELSPNTEYIVAILVEEDGKTEYSYSDLKIVEFTTQDVQAAAEPFEYTITLNESETTYFNVYADVTTPEGTTVYTAWLDEQSSDDDATIKDYIINNGYRGVGGDFTRNITTNNAGQTKYLYLLIIDAEGNYSIGYKELKSKEVVYNEDVEVTIENVEFFTADKVCDITLGGLEGVEFTSIKAYVFPRGGNSYYERTEEQLADLAYGTEWTYRNYSTNPFTVTQTADYKYTAVEGTTYFVAVAVNFADGTVSKTVCQEFTFGEVKPVEPDYVVAFTAVEYLGVASDYYLENFHKFKFTNDAGYWMELAMHPNDVVDGLLPVGEFPINWTNQGEVYGNATMICKELCGVSYDQYITSGNVVISKDGDVYTVVVTSNNVNSKSLKATFEGTMVATGGDSGNEGGEGGTQETDGVFVTATSAVDGNWTYVTFADSFGNTLLVPFGNGGANSLNAGTWDFENWYDSGYAITNVYYNTSEWVDSCTAVVAHVDGKYDIVFTTSIGEFTFNGEIEGLVVPEAVSPTDATVWTITEVNKGWSNNSNETEVVFTSDTGYKVQIDFAAALTDGKIPAGTYSWTNGIKTQYCYHRAGATDQIGMKDVTVVVTDNGDGTATYDATWVPNEDGAGTFKFTWTGTIA